MHNEIMLEDIPQEISILEAIYADNCKWKLIKNKENNLYEITLKLSINFNKNNNEADYIPGFLIFTIDYTNDKIPTFHLELDHQSKFWTEFDFTFTTFKDEIEKAVIKRINELDDQNKVFECYQSALEVLNSLVNKASELQNKKSKEKENNKIECSMEAKEEQELFLELTYIDHMRDYKNYLKLLTEWTNQLNLEGNLIHKKITTGELTKAVYLVLKGYKANLSEFNQRLRTQNVDVNSRGKPCKEKMSKLLYSQKAESTIFSSDIKELQVQYYESTLDLKNIMHNFYSDEKSFLKEFSKIIE